MTGTNLILAVAAANIIVGVAIGLLVDRLRQRPRLVYWFPHAFHHVLKMEPGKGTSILTHAITIQNVGGRRAEAIEICHNQKPDHFQLSPSLSYKEERADDGYIIRVETLGPKEFFVIEVLSYTMLPELKYVRHQDGHAQLIKTMPVRQFPGWFYKSAWALMLIGAGYFLYWILRVGEFILKGVGVLT